MTSEKSDFHPTKMQTNLLEEQPLNSGQVVSLLDGICFLDVTMFCLPYYHLVINSHVLIIAVVALLVPTQLRITKDTS